MALTDGRPVTATESLRQTIGELEVKVYDIAQERDAAQDEVDRLSLLLADLLTVIDSCTGDIAILAQQK